MKAITARPGLAHSPAEQSVNPKREISAILPGYALQERAEARRDRLIAPENYPLQATRRLLVVTPEGELEDETLARRVWQLASPAGLQVLFLGRTTKAENTAAVRRRVALLAAAVQQGEVEARASVASGKSWQQAVQEALRVGDVLVCVGEHRVRQLGLRRQRLGEVLATAFMAPVYLIGGLAVGPSPDWLGRLHALGAWSLSIAILVGFGGLQIWLSAKANPRFAPALICLAIIAEGITLFKTIEWMG